ncbi:MAG: hypothetical protein OXK77_05845 [Gemmatimonadota bacterium]|nr:hypothetical protein [Gemmatimonadota bacterium]MDE2866286.1 hypothetical protein [Gemmatimonadota bacterium]
MTHTGAALAIPLALSLPTLFNGVSAAQIDGPDLILLDSLVLEETGEHHIGNPLGLFVGADGSVLVSDGFAQTVLRYDTTGRLIGRFGRGGQGPGEFMNLGGVGFVAATVAGFLDESGRLELFGLTDGAQSGRVRMDMNNRTSSFSVREDSLWYAGINPVSSATFGAVAIPDLLNAVRADEQPAPILLNRGVAPAPYAEAHALARSLSHAFIDVGDDDVILGFTASPFLLRTDHAGDGVDTAWIAPGGRRGEPAEDEFIAAMRSDRATSQQDLRSWMLDFFESVSFVRDLSRDEHGNVYTVHQDADRDDEGSMTGVRLYLAVSRFDGEDGCADTLIPTSDIGAPVPFLEDSTLWVLDRRLAGAATAGLATVVRRFAIDAEQCTGRVR